MADYFDWNNFGTGAQQRFTGQSPWGSGEMGNPLEQGVSQGTQLFKQQFKNLLGRDPTADELGAFQVNALAGALPNGTNPGYGDLNGISQGYIQNTFGPEAAKYQQGQQQSQLSQSQQMIQDLIGKQTDATTKQLTDPSSPTYQAFAGRMNNMGISPSSGAFQAGLGGVLGQNASQAINSALGSISIPTIGGIQSLAGNPYEQSFKNSQGALTDLNNIRDFNLQAILAKQLGSMGQPSGAQNILGMASGAAQGGGSLLQGGSAAKTATSYVCLELIRHGFLCESDMDDFHVHIMPALFKKGRAFWKYAMDGKRLVDAVNARGLDWKAFKPLLFDRVMDEADSCKAVDLYADACHQLCISADRTLWDPKVYRTSVLDSLRFLPLLFLYTPFLKALWKCVRPKMFWIYDKPACGAHR